jgi:hypothetical protein
MTTEELTFSSHIRKRDAGYKTFARPYSLRRFRHFIKHTEWDEVIHTQEEWIENMFIGVIIVASIYFIPPVLVMLFLG